MAVFRATCSVLANVVCRDTLNGRPIHHERAIENNQGHRPVSLRQHTQLHQLERSVKQQPKPRKGSSEASLSTIRRNNTTRW